MCNMWQYYRDKYYTPMGAVRGQYPDMLAKHPELMVLVLIAENANEAVDKYMNTLTGEDEE